MISDGMVKLTKKDLQNLLRQFKGKKRKEYPAIFVFVKNSVVIGFSFTDPYTKKIQEALSHVLDPDENLLLKFYEKIKKGEKVEFKY